MTDMTAAQILESMQRVDRPAAAVPIEGRVEVDFTAGDGERLDGAFVYRIPHTAGDYLKIGKLAAALRGAFTVDDLGGGGSIADMIATLAVCCTDVPPWARGDSGKIEWEQINFSVLAGVHAEVAAHTARFLQAGVNHRARHEARD